LKFDAGVFNGQGLTGPEEYDSYKDFISRVSLKPYSLSKTVSLSAGLSFFEGGIIQNSNFIYQMGDGNSDKHFSVDSSVSNIGEKAPRKYRGLDAQLRIKNGWGKTELRGEYWWGTQTSSATTSETPTALFFSISNPYYVRPFNGAFFYLLHSFDRHNQLGIKYDWYDPNTLLAGNEINSAVGAHPADIKYNTFGLGYIHYFDENLKVVAWYEFVKNETTELTGYTTDIKDDVLTLRLQFRF